MFDVMISIYDSVTNERLRFLFVSLFLLLAYDCEKDDY